MPTNLYLSIEIVKYRDTQQGARLQDHKTARFQGVQGLKDKEASEICFMLGQRPSHLTTLENTECTNELFCLIVACKNCDSRATQEHLYDWEQQEAYRWLLPGKAALDTCSYLILLLQGLHQWLTRQAQQRLNRDRWYRNLLKHSSFA